jgi:hypothetical protein
MLLLLVMLKWADEDGEFSLDEAAHCFSEFYRLRREAGLCSTAYQHVARQKALLSSELYKEHLLAFQLLYSMYYNSFNDVLFLMKMEGRTLRFRVSKDVLLIECLLIVICSQRNFRHLTRLLFKKFDGVHFSVWWKIRYEFAK